MNYEYNAFKYCNLEMNYLNYLHVHDLVCDFEMKM